MIKSLKKSDISVTPFDVQKNWEASNLNPSNLILWELQDSSGTLAAEYIDYGDNGANYPVTNSLCALALQQQDTEYVSYQKGILNTSILYPTASFYPVESSQYNSTENPINLDSTYMNLIYAENQHLFYNSYNNFTKTFGMESADLSTTNRLLTPEMDVFTIPPSKFGEKIVPKSVNITDESFSKTYTIIDDGNCNLVFSGSIFSAIQTDDYIHSRQGSLGAILSSLDNGTGSNQYCSIATQSLGDNTFYSVSSSILTISPSGGVAPYDVTWYIGGYYRDGWRLNSQTGTQNYLTYNLSYAPSSSLYFDDTFVVCRIIDMEDTQVYSNFVYLKLGNQTPSITTSGSFVPPVVVFPPSAPPTSPILHLTNTGESKILINGVYLDNRYELYNYIPDTIVVNNVGGMPSGISPYSSSYVGTKGDEWILPTHGTAAWISAIHPDITRYTNTYVGDFIYRTYFDFVTADGIPFAPDLNFTLNGMWAADNTGSIFVNGVDTNNYLIPLNSSDNSTFTDKHAFAITGGFHVGRNYLEFRIHNTIIGNNINSVLENPVGLYVEFNKDNNLFRTYSPPVITNQYINNAGSPQTIQLGFAANFSTTVLGDQPIIYQWYKDGIAISNQISNEYNILHTQISDVGTYVLSASNNFGSSASSPMELSIYNPIAPLQAVVYGYVSALWNGTYSVWGHGNYNLKNNTSNQTLIWMGDGIGWYLNGVTYFQAPKHPQDYQVYTTPGLVSVYFTGYQSIP